MHYRYYCITKSFYFLLKNPSFRKKNFCMIIKKMYLKVSSKYLEDQQILQSKLQLWKVQSLLRRVAKTEPKNNLHRAASPILLLSRRTENIRNSSNSTNRLKIKTIKIITHEPSGLKGCSLPITFSIKATPPKMSIFGSFLTIFHKSEEFSKNGPLINYLTYASPSPGFFHDQDL